MRVEMGFDEGTRLNRTVVLRDKLCFSSIVYELGNKYVISITLFNFYMRLSSLLVLEVISVPNRAELFDNLDLVAPKSFERNILYTTQTKIPTLKF